MDNNTEKYGIELDLLITKFKNKVNQVKNDIKGLGQQAKANVGDIEVNINMKTLEKDIANTKAEIQSLNEQMKEYQKYGYTSSPFYKSLSKDLDIATQKLEKFEQAQKEVNAELESAPSVSAKATVSIGNSFDRLSKKITRYALSLFSIRSIYALMSRASSAYLTQDTELANKLQGAWIGLGAILSPIIEKITNLIIKMVSYINVFAQALTGVNYIAKATAKYMNTVASSTKNANKQLASFDELTTLASETSSTGTTNNPFDAFDDVKLDDTIVKKLQDMAYWLKENWNWIKLVGEVLIATFAISKLAGVISSIGKVTTALGAGSGLLGTLTSIATIGAIGVTIYIAGSIMQDIKEIEQFVDNAQVSANKFWKSWVDAKPAISDVYDEIEARNPAMTEALEQSQKWWNQIFGLSDEYLQNIDTAAQIMGILVDYLRQQYEQGDLNEEQQIEMITKLQSQVDKNQEIINQLREQGEDTYSLVETNGKYRDLTREVYENLKEQGKSQEEILKLTGLTKDDINDIYGICEKPVTMEFDVDTSKAEKNYSNFFTKLGESLGSLATTEFWSSGLSGAWKKLKSIWSFDVGTNYVPSDNLAMVHKGEAIIPKKFNNKEFLSKMGGNEETNALLIDLIDAVNNIEINPYTTVKDVGKASVNYINQQNRIQGRSVIK